MANLLIGLGFALCCIDYAMQTADVRCTINHTMSQEIFGTALITKNVVRDRGALYRMGINTRFKRPRRLTRAFFTFT